MKNILGNVITLTLFGESHGPCIGGVLDGLPPGLSVDEEYIMKEMSRRRSIAQISTPRIEADVPEFLSGVKDGMTEGTPLAFIIRNNNVDSSSYESIRNISRPGHADYTAQAKYLGFQDPAGGGHFSGRLTAGIVAAGAIVRKALEEKGILIGTHICELAGVSDRPFDENDICSDIRELNEKPFAVLDADAAESMQKQVLEARAAKDSVGGILETAVIGIEPGIGEPVFSSIESELSRAVFSIGAVKGIEFGRGFELARMRGSEANDQFRITDGRVTTETNNNGGINGGISNGMPVLFRSAVKPTPSIGIRQKTVDFVRMENTETETGGRHDPAVVHRARAVVDAVTALVIADLICQRYGYMWLRND